MTNLTQRKYTPADYEIIAPWFVEHGWPKAPDADILPTTGFIVEDEGVPVGVGFLYLSNSKLGFMDWLATSPSLGMHGVKVLKFLIALISHAAKKSDMTHIMHITHGRYKKFLEKQGFLAGEDLTTFIKGVA